MTTRPKYLEMIEKQLKLPARRNPAAPLAYDLFAGCGGLALGLEAAGFHTVGFEMLPDACMTYRENLRGPCNEVVLGENTDLELKSVHL
jgi:DNA (cytosine-5)-methyltransferase 1